jgi:hypothetical protein
LSLEYALITDSCLPEEVKKSEYFVAVDKKQWLDLIDYSEGLVDADPNQKVLFLIVAKGTPEQEEEAARKKAERQQEWEKLNAEKEGAEQQLLAKELAEKERLKREREEKTKLRKKSESIFNALYHR